MPETPEPPLRERLVDAGVELVLAQGPVGLREIARRAGVSHGAPRRYFPTHQALLSAIAERGYQELGRRFAAALTRADPPRDQLGAVARAYVAFAVQWRGMFELMFRHDLLGGGQQAAGLPPLRESTLPLFGRLVRLVGRCQVANAAATAAALWAAVHGIAQLWAWGSLQLVVGDAPEQLDRLIATALDAHLN